MNAYLSPGVYRLPPPSNQRAVALVRTDVAGFVGYAERGPVAPFGPALNRPVDLAVKIESWAEYQRVFGGLTATGYMSYAVRGFFANGGTRCYVVRVAAASNLKLRGAERPAPATLSLTKVNGKGPALTLAPRKRFKTGDTTLALGDASGIAAGDVVAVESKGVRFFSMVVDVGDDHTVELAVPLTDAFGEDKAQPASVIRYAPAITFRAISPVVIDGIPWTDSPGQWGNRIRLDLVPESGTAQVQDFSLRVSVDPGPDTSFPAEAEFYRIVSLNPNSPYFAPNVINGVSRLVAVTIDQTDSEGPVLDLKDGPLADPAQRSATPSLTDRARQGPSGGSLAVRSALLQGGRDGLSRVQPQDFIGGPDDLRGLRLLEEVDEVAILVCPDCVFVPSPTLEQPPLPASPSYSSKGQPAPLAPERSDRTKVPPSITQSASASIIRAMLDQCERLRDRVAIVDSPDELQAPTPNELKVSPARSALGSFIKSPAETVSKTVTDWRALFDSPFGAIYFPWLLVTDPLGIDGTNRRVPPSGHVAGIYARTDNLYGVQRPPANVALEDVTDVAVDVTAAVQELLNPNGVDAAAFLSRPGHPRLGREVSRAVR